MAQLTLSERSELQNNTRFQQRLASAVAKTAKFWNDFLIDQFSEYNIANQKRKAYARTVLKAGIGPSNTYAGSFLSSYNTDISGPGILEDDQAPFNAQTNQLSDTELTDSSASSYVFDHFAGVEVGDTTKQINL